MINTSGGLIYLFRAMRYRKTLWRPFVLQSTLWVESWAKEVQALGKTRLWLFGPNAGWTLPMTMMSYFEEIIVLEPDPLARRILRLRFKKSLSQVSQGRTKITFQDSPLGFEPLKFSQWISKLQKLDAVLFSNVLGQWSLSFCGDLESTQEQFRPLFQKLFERAGVASYHDRLSVDLENGQSQAFKSRFSSSLSGLMKSNIAKSLATRQERDLAEIFEKGSAPIKNQVWIEGLERAIQEFTDATPSLSLTGNSTKTLAQSPIEVCDHGLEGFFGQDPKLRWQYYHWELTPGRVHWIEWISTSIN